ncbi:hypothetical protein R3P38DRAFT_2644762 [Favolaschia claudopus]|uniref:Apple domain-containing protein n=1 Tax=Favolaschia claudopus TaxID=2862362 RepID=A0AAW0AGA0_9AGAR
MDNGNFETIYNITELACMRTCSADNGCVAYAMDPYGSIRTPGPACFLKNSVNLTSFTMQIDDVSVGLIGQCGT